MTGPLNTPQNTACEFHEEISTHQMSSLNVRRNPWAMSVAPLDDLPPRRARERTMAQCERLPFLEMLSGRDALRVHNAAHWAGGSDYAWVYEGQR